MQYGRGTSRDLPAAAKFYKMAADRGHAEGLYVAPGPLTSVHFCNTLVGTAWLPSRRRATASLPT